jgi:hypothetical protein
MLVRIIEMIRVDPPKGNTLHVISDGISPGIENLLGSQPLTGRRWLRAGWARSSRIEQGTIRA